jgi:DNA-directed RNA polymerase specialized sigma24 family protein
VSIVLGQDTYESVSRRMKLPRSTCYLTVARGLDKLRNVLEDVPEVAEYLERHAVKETE